MEPPASCTPTAIAIALDALVFTGAGLVVIAIIAVLIAPLF